MKMNELIEQHFSSEQEILERFGHERNWHVAPLDDARDSWWLIIDGSLCWWNEEPEDIEDAEYDGEIVNNYIHRVEGYCLVHIDTSCDGNEFLMILDEEKELKPNE